MTTIEISEAEKAGGALSATHREAAGRAIREDGFVVLHNAVDLDHVAALRDRVLEDVAALQARKDAPYNWNTGNIQQDPPPFPPYLFKEILVNEFAIQAAAEVLGPRFKNNFYSGNTAVSGDQRQPVHGDSGHLWRHEVAAPAYALVINFPLVDMSPENGATELWPGSHLDTSVYWFDGGIEVPAEALEKRRATHPPFQPTVPAGSLVIRDLRLWHAGMPNRTKSPRPMVALIFWADWMQVGADIRFPKGTEEFFQHPVLTTHAQFVDGPIDYIQTPHAYAYNHEEKAS